MSATQTAVAAIVATTPETVKAAGTWMKAETGVQSSRVNFAKVTRTVADRNGWNREQARDLAKYSLREAGGMKGKSEAEVKDFDDLWKSRVSTILTLAYPVDTHAGDVKQAIAENEKGNLPRIGENKLIEIARGNITLADVRAGKKPTRNSASGSTSTMTPSEKFANAIAGALSAANVGLKDGLDWKDAEKAIAEAVKIRKAAQAAKK